MAEPSNSFFSQKALDKMRGVDDLNKRLRIANPGFWAVLCACAVFLAGFLIWGVFGRITTNVSVTGVKIDGQIHCFLTAEEASEVEVGNPVNADGEQMKVAEISQVPLSREEAQAILRSDYLTDMLIREKWEYHVTLEGDMPEAAESAVVPVHIVTNALQPIRLILGGED